MLVLFQRSQYTYAIPRAHSGGVILGGERQPRVRDTKVDIRTKADILRRVNQLTNSAFQSIDLE